MNAENGAWAPPDTIPRPEVVKLSSETLDLPDIPVASREDIFRIRALGMDWDIGTMTHVPEDPARIPKAPDGRRAGIFLLHGGTSDFKSLEPVARMLATKFGFKVTLMTFPGRLYLLDPSRDWPGDTLESDGSGRTPLWTRETRITRDQYHVARDDARRESYGTVISLVAREGTEFYHRMAAWPVAFEEALRESCRREFDPSEYALYVHGHSTGGPFAMITAQRVANVEGVLGYGSSTFAYIYTATTGDRWEFPFNHLRLRTWRDTARYLYEGLKDKGYGLPMLMELTMEKWEVGKKRTNFKAEDFVHKNGAGALDQAARVTARRLKMSGADEERLVTRYLGYLRELSGPNARPVPPMLSLHGLDDDTVTLRRCCDALPLYAAMDPAPKVACVSLGAGIHTWGLTYDDLPRGIIPPVCRLWHDAIVGGFFTR